MPFFYDTYKLSTIMMRCVLACKTRHRQIFYISGIADAKIENSIVVVIRSILIFVIRICQKCTF